LRPLYPTSGFPVAQQPPINDHWASMFILFDQIAPRINIPLVPPPDPIAEPNSRVNRQLASTPWNFFCVSVITDAKSGSASSLCSRRESRPIGTVN
jgi:hypothetical protein